MNRFNQLVLSFFLFIYLSNYLSMNLDCTKMNYVSYSLYYFCTKVAAETDECESCGQMSV